MKPPPEMTARLADGVGEPRGAEHTKKLAANPNMRPGCGKAAAVALYLYGILPLERVADMFRRNPAWRHA
jgi:hypothetical protein